MNLPTDGPQTDVSISEVESKRWVQCYSQNLNDELTDTMIDGVIRPACYKDKVMMGCKKKNVHYLEVVAWSPSEEVFVDASTSRYRDETECGQTGTVILEYTVDDDWFPMLREIQVENRAKSWTKTCSYKECQRGKCFNFHDYIGYDLIDAWDCKTCTCNDGTCSGNTSEESGVKWYRTTEGVEQGSWGFADASSNVVLSWVDVASDANDAMRLTLHVNNNNGNFKGGHRCGVKKAQEGMEPYDAFIEGFDENGDWELVFYHAY